MFTADEGIARNPAARTIFTHLLRRRNRGSLAIFFAEEIAHPGASKNRAILWGAVKIAAAAAENRAIFVHPVAFRTLKKGTITKARFDCSPQKGPENWCHTKTVEDRLDTFLLTFAIVCPAQEMWRSVENLLGVSRWSLFGVFFLQEMFIPISRCCASLESRFFTMNC